MPKPPMKSSAVVQTGDPFIDVGLRARRRAEILAECQRAFRSSRTARRMADRRAKKEGVQR